MVFDLSPSAELTDWIVSIADPLASWRNNGIVNTCTVVNTYKVTVSAVSPILGRLPTDIAV